MCVECCEYLGGSFLYEFADQKTWDGAVEALAELGLVLPGSVAQLKAKGQTMYASAT